MRYYLLLLCLLMVPGVLSAYDDAQRYYPFNDTTGTTGIEYISGAWNASLDNGANFNTSITINGVSCAYMDGVNDYINISASGILHDNKNFTYDGWVYFLDIGGTTDYITEMRDDTTNADGFNLNADGSNKFNILADEGGGSWVNFVNASSLTLINGVWHHIGVVHTDGVSIAMYHNGTRVNLESHANGVDDPAWWVFGRKRQAGDFTRMLVCEWKFFPSAKTDAEMLGIHNYEKSGIFYSTYSGGGGPPPTPNITTTLNYPTNKTTYYGDGTFNGSIYIGMTNVNETALCTINDSRFGGFCSQYAPTVSSDCGAVGSGAIETGGAWTSPSNAYDNDLGTYATASIVGGDYMYFNFTRPNISTATPYVEIKNYRDFDMYCYNGTDYILFASVPVEMLPPRQQNYSLNQCADYGNVSIYVEAGGNARLYGVVLHWQTGDNSTVSFENTSELAPGNYSIYVECEDVGNKTSSETFWFNLDSNLTLDLVYPNNTSTYTSFNYSVLVNISGAPFGPVMCSINDSSWAPVAAGPYVAGDIVDFRNTTGVPNTNLTLSINCTDSVKTKQIDLWVDLQTSLIINIYDTDTGIILNTSLIELVIYNDAFYNSSFSTTNGTFNISSLSAGEYTAVFSSINYTTVSYVFNMAYGSTTYLNAYMDNDTSSVIFTITDSNKGQSIEGASVTIMRYVSDVLTVVNVLESDVTGRVTFEYQTGTLYHFIVTASGYNDKTFSLNPIIYSSYTVQMTQTEAVTDTSDYTGISLYYSPKIYYEGENNFSIVFSMPNGSLQYYGVNLSYPGGTNTSQGTNSYGEALVLNFNITGADFGDYINITAYYKLLSGDMKVYTYLHDIIPYVNNYTFMYNADKTYGLGDFERGFIAVAIALGSGGFVALFIGPTGGLALALLMFGYFAYIGFISGWVIIIPVLGGVIYIIWRSSL